MARHPARRTGGAPETETVEIRLIARDGLTQTLAAQIAAAIPNCPAPRVYLSRKTPGHSMAYMRFTIPTTPPALDA
ncbi:hypothetical protein [Streptomyces jumonjinensis]|uniref:hypothetical protein n=1 Tax=Streptomyces jumonjinensis TaxID=1945 RepID=UPI0037A4A8AB